LIDDIMLWGLGNGALWNYCELEKLPAKVLRRQDPSEKDLGLPAARLFSVKIRPKPKILHCRFRGAFPLSSGYLQAFLESKPFI